VKRAFALCGRFLGRCGRFIADLFKGPGNHYWELGRVILGSASALMGLATAWNIYLHQAIDLAALGTGLAAIITAGAILIPAKDWVRSKHPPTSES
jgi:hypothetical protein